MMFSRAGFGLGQQNYSWSDLDLELVLAVSVSMLLLVLLYCFFHGFLSEWKSSKLPPGPWPWPIVGNFPHIASALPHRTLRSLANKFGGLMYLKLGTKPCIVVSSEAVARELFQTRDALFSSRPQMLFWTASSGGSMDVKQFSGAPYGVYWQNLRRLCNTELFTAKRQASYERIRTEEIHDMMKALLEDSSQPLTLNTRLYGLAANNITRMLTHKRYFGTGVTVKDEQEREDFKRLVRGHINMFSKFVVSDYVPALSFVPKWQGIHAEFEAFFEFEHAVMDRMFQLEKHRERAKQRRRQQQQQEEGGSNLGKDLLYVPDFVDVLLTAPLEGGRPLSDKEINIVLMDMIIGATETAATTIGWAMAELILHPRAMKQVQEELDTVVGANRLVQESDIPNLPYLEAFIKEVFRMHPAVPLSLPRQSTHATELLGFMLPSCTHLILNIFAIQRDPSVYKNPEVFNPERFVGHSEVDQTSAFNAFELMPFSAGRRMCPGYKIGNLLISLVLAHLLHSFNWSLPEGQSPESVDMTETFGATMPMETPLSLIAQPKSPVYLY